MFRFIGKTETEVWKMLKEGLVPYYSTYVGITLDVALGPRKSHFTHSLLEGRPFRSAIQEELMTRDVQVFQVAVIILSSLKEARDLEEFITVSLNLPLILSPSDAT